MVDDDVALMNQAIEQLVKTKPEHWTITGRSVLSLVLRFCL
jgi:lauroyl/myristoyl acyltransferase